MLGYLIERVIEAFSCRSRRNSNVAQLPYEPICVEQRVVEINQYKVGHIISEAATVDHVVQWGASIFRSSYTRWFEICIVYR